MNDAEKRNFIINVTKALKMLGVNIGARGYDYTKDALILIAESDALSRYGSIQLYQMVADKYSESSVSKVERSIRNFVSNAFNEGNSFYTKAIGITDKKPSNSHFLKAMSEYLKYNNV